MSNQSDFAADVTHHYRIYESIWRNMDREDGLVNNRITWALVLSGGLLTATFVLSAVIVAIINNGPKFGSPANASGLITFVMAILAAIGCYFSFKSKQGVDAAFGQISYLQEQYKEQGGKALFEDRYKLPRPFGDKRDNEGGSNAATAFPTILISFWGTAVILEIVVGVMFFSGKIL
jgi:hypothetical protein